MAATTIAAAPTPLWVASGWECRCSNSSWGLPVKGINFIGPGVAQQDGRIIES